MSDWLRAERAREQADMLRGLREMLRPAIRNTDPLVRRLAVVNTTIANNRLRH